MVPKNMMDGLTAQPWEMAENATYAITLGGGDDDYDITESASSDHVQVYFWPRFRQICDWPCELPIQKESKLTNNPQQVMEEAPVAVARVKEIGGGGNFQEMKSNLENFFNFPPSIGGDENGFQIIEIPSSGDADIEIDMDGKRTLVKAASDMMKAAGYKAETERE